MKIIKEKFMITIIATVLLLILKIVFNKNDKLKKIISNLLLVDYIIYKFCCQV